jgi:1-acyl-sn-glycerol-3-phosphate acyltransferase
MVAYRLLRGLLRLLMRCFFRQIEVVGLEHVPADGGVIFAGNHPNSLIDPVLIVTTCGRIVSFAAKDVLFRSRLLRAILRALGAIPIARRDDHGDVAGQNDRAFQAMFALLGGGGAVGIFPEGISHDASHLARLKTGAARIALGAAARHGTPLKIVPCGLTFVAPKRFRSRVLVAAFRADGPAAVRALTEEIERSLRGLTVNAPDWETVRVLDGVRRLYQPPQISIEQRVELARRFNEHYPRFAAEPQVAGLYRRVAAYLERLDALGLSDRDLRREMTPARAAGRVARGLLLLLWLPLAAPGIALHAPVILFARFAGKRLSPRKDVVATTKMIVGLLLILLSYATVVTIAGLLVGALAAAGAAVFLPLSGYAMLKVLDRAVTLRRGLRALARTLSPRAEVAALARERVELEEATVRIVEQLRPADLTPLFPRSTAPS